MQLASGAGPSTRRASFVASRAGCGTRSRSWLAWRTPSAWRCTVDDERARDIWGPAGAELLAALFLAAKLAGIDLAGAYAWLQSELEPTAVVLLEQGGFTARARSVRGSMEAPAEPRGSVVFTTRTATRCLRDPNITAWTTPWSGLDTFDPEAFVRSRQRLYLLSKDGGGSAPRWSPP